MKQLKSLLIVLIVLSITKSKVITQSYTLRKLQKVNWQFLQKFGYSKSETHSGTWKVSFKLNKAIKNKNHPENKVLPVQLQLILDTEWDQYDTTKKECNQHTHLMKTARKVEIPMDGSLKIEEGILQNKLRDYIWYFSINTCDIPFSDLYNSNHKLIVELTLMNNGSHFSQEEGNMVLCYIVLFCCILFFQGNSIYKFYKGYQEGNNFDTAHFIVLLATLAQAFGLFWEMIDEIIFSSNGKGSQVCDLFGQLSQISSECVITFLLILFSWGWTVYYDELENWDIYIPIGIIIVMINLLVMGLGKITDGFSNKFHNYDGFAGYIIVIIRILMFIYFLYNILDTYQKATNIKQREFIKILGLLSSIYFLALPIMLVFDQFFAAYLRHKIITIGILSIQTITLVLFDYICTSKKSSYYNISTKNKLLLPGLGDYKMD